MQSPFIGTEAVAAGHLTEGQLRARYRHIYRGIYIPRDSVPSLDDRIVGAQLAAPNSVVTGLAASAIHGAKWVEDDAPIELITTTRRQPGLIVRRESLLPDEWWTTSRIRVATPERTAFDLARHLPRDRAVARLDALACARPFSLEGVMLIAKCHPGVRGLRRLEVALPLVDGGAESPRETWLRLLFIDAGLPRPTTQFVVCDEHGRYVRRIDMVWEDYKVGAEYDGEQHLTSRRQYALDVHVNRVLQRLNWDVLHVIKEDRGPDIVAQARDALMARGWRPDRK